MKHTIGFTNFRRFKKFPEIDLGDITILVGGNNAGKSTLVKAMLLMRDFLKSRIESLDNTKEKYNILSLPQFSFDTEHVNVGDFYRAFCRQSDKRDNTISFTMKIDKFRFIVNITGERKPGIIPQVSLIALFDEDKDISFTFDFTKGKLSACFGYDKLALNTDVDNSYQINQEIDRLKDRLTSIKDLGVITKLKLEIEKLEREKSSILKEYTISEEDEITIDLSKLPGGEVGKLVVPELIKCITRYSETGTLGDKRSNIYRVDEANKSFIDGKKATINTIAEELEGVINSQVIEYIYAHSVYQDSIYAKCANSSDYTKRTIHEFFSSRISCGDEEFSLIENWLEKFKIGTSLKVIPYKGDNYSLVIFDKDNPEITSEKKKGYPGGIDLADKGMGTIQVVILLLRIATLIRKYRGQQLTILLEEPEQNLHPAVQSQLADLIYEINQEYDVNFIIETHSEYLIRRTQVLVADINKSNVYVGVPFKVIYLPENNDEPYDMQYRPDGKFLREFGPGFFDEAAKLAFKIF